VPTYIALTKYTQKGIEAIADSARRHAEQQETFRRLGVVSKDLYLTMGSYDLVHVMEAPDDETMMKLSLTLNSWGWVRTETLRAFTVDEFRRLVEAVR
jgi:uncharacterized protein with GYD domain